MHLHVIVSISILIVRTCQIITQLKDFAADVDNLSVLVRPVTSGHTNVYAASASMDSSTHASHSSSLGQSGDTLLKLLLRVKLTQSACLQVVVEQCLSLSAAAEADGDSSNGDVSSLSGPIHSLCVQCLNHVKWCDNIQDSDRLLCLLLDAAQVLYVHMVT